MPHRRPALILTMLLTLLVGAAPAASATAERSCRDVTVPVSLSEGADPEYTVYGRLCEPTGVPVTTVQLLLSGLTYDHTYWDLPDPAGGEKYSYAVAANQAGMATLALDRIGIGRSSRPPGLAVTIEANAYVAHQVIQVLRGEFGKVVLVGHSYGSWTSWYESSTYRDVDAVIFSGISHGINATAPLRLLTRLYPAALDSALHDQVSDLTYLTSLPEQRYEMFHAPGQVDPALLRYDEEHKQTVTLGEIDNFPLILAHPLDVRAPVLLANGSEDPLFCGLLAADCSTPEGLVAYERPRLGEHVPFVEGYVLPGVGHDLNYAPNASEWFTAAQRWIAAQIR